MKINITYAASVANAPAGYSGRPGGGGDGEGLIQDPITVNITFGHGDVGSQACARPTPSASAPQTMVTL